MWRRAQAARNISAVAAPDVLSWFSRIAFIKTMPTYTNFPSNNAVSSRRTWECIMCTADKVLILYMVSLKLPLDFT